MFGSAKPTGFGTAFGGQTSTFGTSTPFGGGTGTNTFGAKPTGSTGFGTPTFGTSTPAAGGLFGGNQNNSGGGLFGGQQTQQQTNTFGQTPSTGFTFGATPSTSGGLFGQTNTNATTGGLFSTPATSNAFAQKTPGFGGFGATNTTTSTATGGGLFGTTQTSNTSLFGQSTSTGLFGSTATSSGTVTKFSAPSGQDTMVKNGVTQQINTHHQCITAMKEYESKSLEELRMEDYAENRKSKQAQPAAAGGLFASTPATQSTGVTGFAFGQQNKPSGFGTTSLFGGATQTTTASTGLFGATPQQPQQSGGLFGQNKPLFGTTPAASSSTGFGFGTGTPNTSTSLFGQNKPLFGTATTTQSGGLFGGTSGANTFGATSSAGFGFGTSTPAAGGLFGQTKPTGFGTATATTQSTGFSFGQNTASNLFAKPFNTSTNTPGFGANTNTNTGLFGNKPTGFGTPSSFNLSTNTSSVNPSGGLFGNNTLNKPNSFGFNTPGNTTGIGQAGATTGFNFGGNTATAGTTTNPLASQTAPVNLTQQLIGLTQSPYGDSPLYWNLKQTESKREDVLKPTNPAAQKSVLQNSSQYKVSPRPTAKIKPKSLHSLTNGSKAQLFDGLEDEDFSFGNDTFMPRKSVKKLVLKKKGNKDLSMQSRTSSQSDEIPDLHSVNDFDPSNYRTDPMVPSSQGPPIRDLDPTDNDNIIRTNLLNNHLAENNTPNRNSDNLDDTIAALNAKNKALSKDTSLDSSILNSTSQEESFIIRSKTPPPHPANIVLTRPGYYTVPDLDGLAKMVDKNGDCFVDDFTVGREGYGSVFFKGVTNVANMNLDEIVYFRRKEVIIYPDDDNKPPLGEGLNKKAEVTLDCVWPTDKTTHSPVKDPSRLLEMSYVDKIEEITAKIGAKFIEYRPETGSWVFEVKHFSKYGLVEDSDEEDLTEQEKKRIKLAQQQQLAVQKQTIKVQKNGQKTSPPTAAENVVTDIQVATKTPSEDASYGEPMGEDDTDMPDITRERIPDEMLDISEKFDETSEGEPSSYRIANSLGVKAHNMQVMKASFFDDEEMGDKPSPGMFAKQTNKTDESPLMRKGDAPTTPHLFSATTKSKFASPVKLTQIPQTDARKDAHGVFTPRLVTPEPVRPIQQRPVVPTPEYPIIPSGLTSQDIAQKIVGCQVQREIPDVKDSLTFQKQLALVDAGCFMGRRFRVGWGPGWTLVHSGTPLHKVQEEKTQEKPFSILPSLHTSKHAKTGSSRWTVTIEKLNVADYFNPKDTTVVQNHENLLEVQLDHSVSAREEGCPLFAPSASVKCLHEYTEQIRTDKEESASHPDCGTVEHMEMVWNLCVALWGNIPEFEGLDVAENSYIYHQGRREAFSRWLSTTASKKIRDEVQSSKYKGNSYLISLLSLLSGRQISEACQLAQQSGDHRLAMLISQAMGGHIPRQLVEKQISDWSDLRASQFVNATRLKIYSLLSGNLVWPAPGNAVNTCDEFDWKRSLALHLWFHCKPNAVIAESISEYDRGFKGRTVNGKYCIPPLPPYLENKENILMEIRETEDDDEKDYHVIRDTCYHLLKLYCQKSHRLERILNPTTSTSNQLDFRLSWHTYQILQALGYKHISPYQAACLHSNFSSQLESIGLWEWAIFVVLHIEDRQRREAAVKELLNRHIRLSSKSDYIEKEQFVQEKLMVPLEWIHTAKALRARYENKPHKEAWHLLRAGHWNESHIVIVREIAADAIINDEFEYLKKFLSELVPPDRSSVILDWNIGGQVFLDYITLCESLDELKKGEPDPYDLERLQPEVISLCSRIKNLTCRNSMDRLCQSEMAKKSANLLRTLLSLQSLQHGVELSSARVLAPHISNLPMPEDYELQELQALTRSYMLEMTA